MRLHYNAIPHKAKVRLSCLEEEDPAVKFFPKCPCSCQKTLQSNPVPKMPMFLSKDPAVKSCSQNAQVLAKRPCSQILSPNYQCSCQKTLQSSLVPKCPGSRQKTLQSSLVSMQFLAFLNIEAEFGRTKVFIDERRAKVSSHKQCC